MQPPGHSFITIVSHRGYERGVRRYRRPIAAFRAVITRSRREFVVNCPPLTPNIDTFRRHAVNSTHHRRPPCASLVNGHCCNRRNITEKEHKNTEKRNEFEIKTGNEQWAKSSVQCAEWLSVLVVQQASISNEWTYLIDIYTAPGCWLLCFIQTFYAILCNKMHDIQYIRFAIVAAVGVFHTRFRRTNCECFDAGRATDKQLTITINAATLIPATTLARKEMAKMVAVRIRM